MKRWQYLTITFGVILAFAGASFILPVENASAFMFAGLSAWQGLVALLQLPLPEALARHSVHRWTGLSLLGLGLIWGVLSFLDASTWYLLATALPFGALIAVCEIYGKKKEKEKE